MTAHAEQIASYFDSLGPGEVKELRCTTCGVLVGTFRVTGTSDLAAVQREIHQAWQRHITPPAEPSYEI